MRENAYKNATTASVIIKHRNVNLLDIFWHSCSLTSAPFVHNGMLVDCAICFAPNIASIVLPASIYCICKSHTRCAKEKCQNDADTLGRPAAKNRNCHCTVKRKINGHTLTNEIFMLPTLNGRLLILFQQNFLLSGFHVNSLRRRSIRATAAVMRGLDPRIHVAPLRFACPEAWMAGTSPARMVVDRVFDFE